MRELQLLITLAAHPQRIMTREELFAEVWGGQPRHDDRSVDVYVSRLRAKLGEALPEQQPDPHPQRDRLPLLARRLSSHRALLHLFHILDTAQVTSCRRAAESVAGIDALGVMSTETTKGRSDVQL